MGTSLSIHRIRLKLIEFHSTLLSTLCFRTHNQLISLVNRSRSLLKITRAIPALGLKAS